MRAAAIGIGSNSLRLLVADEHTQQHTPVLRKRIGLRMFASLTSQMEIEQSMMAEACQAIVALKQCAKAEGATIVRLFATSAVRDATNQNAFRDMIFNTTGLTLEIISGKEEARLSFLGAAGESSAGMIDIGGGSTEVVIGDHGTPALAFSLQAGAVRMFQQYPITSSLDIQPVTNAVQHLLAPYMAQLKQTKTPALWVGVGGTMTAAATCIQSVDWHSSQAAHGFSVSRSELWRVLERLPAMPLAERKALGTIPPDRADIVVHGFAILYACMVALSIDHIIISEHTNLDGYLQALTADE